MGIGGGPARCSAPSGTVDIPFRARVVGTSRRAEFVYVDKSPENRAVSIAREVERQIAFPLDRYTSKYVDSSVSLGVLAAWIKPGRIDAAEEKAEIVSLHHTGGGRL